MIKLNAFKFILEIVKNPDRLISNGFFLSLLFIPFTGLFWNYEIGLLKLNWGFLIFFLLSVSYYLFKKKPIKRAVWWYLISFIFYAVVFFINRGEFESLLRIFISLLPFLFIEQINRNSDSINFPLFWNAYLCLLCIPIIISILQLTGNFPFYDPGKALWIVDRGRISGGYLKPNNLVTFVFPAFLYGIQSLYRGDKVKGMLIILMCLFLVVTSTLRIAIIIYLFILAFYFMPNVLIRLVNSYYKYWFPLTFGLISFLVMGILFEHVGPIEGLRERIPMWQAHAHHFLQADLWTMLVGYSKVSLPPFYLNFSEIKYFEEAHNNSLRILTTFGLMGFTLYCLLIRKSILLINRLNSDKNQLFLSSASVLYFIFYSVTNEPSFYVSISWCITCWLFVGNDRHYSSKVNSV